MYVDTGHKQNNFPIMTGPFYSIASEVNPRPKHHLRVGCFQKLATCAQEFLKNRPKTKLESNCLMIRHEHDVVFQA